ncbi:IclR family transcriptional regulator [Actinospica durhamensis]|uniref:Glycerol operon regulatory protein n=1 Tax=Actinospica durhamensis TaxID=1508375 RepID=A0A941EWC8_9ACTN|nr:IclR family transcriptional regulator [Actinospica durhamensis]MBR7838161.1 IclR family transcriptional regulator [Actinospica durhamensis]
MASPTEPSSASRSGVAERLLALLGAFDAQHRELSLTSLARRAGLPAATTHRLVGQLTAWGALEQAEGGGYRIGLRLWEVGCLAPRSSGLRRAVLPFMEDLYETTHENVQLAVRDGLDTLYIELISGRSAVVVRTTVGSRWPLHATGVGLVLLAHAPAAVQERVCARPLARFTGHTITEPARLRATLAEVRRADAAVSDRQITDDAVSVAAPIRDASGSVVAALSLVVPATANPAPLVPAVRMAARGGSRALGYGPGPRSTRAEGHGAFHPVEEPLAGQG